jgi:hypothetical protein
VQKTPGSRSATLVPAFISLQKPSVPVLALLDPDIRTSDPDPEAIKLAKFNTFTLNKPLLSKNVLQPTLVGMFLNIKITLIRS